MQNKKNEDGTQLGIRYNKVYKDVYHISTLPISPELILVINHSQQLLMYSSKKGKIIKELENNLSLPVINKSHSQRYKSIFLQLSDHHLYIYSESLLLLANKININGLRHCEAFYYLDDYHCFLVICPEFIKIVNVQIITNHHRSLFMSSIHFSIKEKKNIKLPKKYFLPFSSKIQKSGNFIYMHNSEDVKIIDISVDPHFIESSFEQGQPITIKNIIDIEKVCQSPQQITQIYFESELNLLVCGTNYGKIRVLKVNFPILFATSIVSTQNLRLDSQVLTVFQVTVHLQKQILDITLYSPKLIISLGADQHLQVVDIDQMISLERIRTNNYNQLHFISPRMFLSVKEIQYESFLYQNTICLDYNVIFQHNSSIVHSLHYPTFNIFNLTDNSLMALYNEKPHKVKQSFIPPFCKTIVSIHEHPYEPSQFWLLTERSEIYKYKISENFKEKMEIIGIQELHTFFDLFKHQKDFKIVKFAFIPVVPIKYDEQVKQKTYTPSKQKPKDFLPVILGCQTGQLFICSGYKLNQIIFRTCYFIEQIQFLIPIDPIYESKGREQKQFIMLYGTSKELMISCISSQGAPKRFYKTKLVNKMILRKFSNNLCALIIGSTISIISGWISEKEQIQLKLWTSSEYLHDSPITSISYEERSKYIISGDETGNINVWTIDGTIIVKLSTSDSVKIQCCNYYQKQLMFGFKGKILMMNKKYEAKNLLTEEQFWKIYQANCIKMNKSIHKLLNIIEKTQEKPFLQKETGQTKYRFSQFQTPPKRTHEFSLPQINSTKQYEGVDFSPSKKVKQHKRRNNHYENLFHFPNKGLYNQLINKNMLY